MNRATKFMRAIIPTIISATVFLMACSSAGPPHGPKYTPSASEESATDCPKERGRAQAAREALLGTRDPLLRQRSIQMVFEHAECEESVLKTLASPQGDADQILAGLRALRGQSTTAITLYKEVRLHGKPMLLIRSLVAQGRIKIAFAKAARATAAPAELDVSQRAEFQGELAIAAKVLHQEAQKLLEEALLLAGSVDEAEVARAEACRLLASISASSTACPAS
ncbi:MAG: hypothetical protein JKY56_13635 [Kofleriaceae bacterium]|nr:hypothetical protein [Kofleriaceae bacterium]